MKLKPTFGEVQEHIRNGGSVLVDKQGEFVELLQNPNPAPLTEGRKDDSSKPRMDLISPYAMEELGKVLAYGAKKYADRNWEKGIAWSRIVAALLRHLFAYLRGELVDPESGLSHLAHVLCNAHFLVHYLHTKKEFDDLPKVESK